MMLAAGSGHKSVITELLKAGAKINAPKRQDVVKALFEAGLGAESSLHDGFNSNCASPILVFPHTSLSDHPERSARASSPSECSSPVVVFRSGGSHDRRERLQSPSPGTRI